MPNPASSGTGLLTVTALLQLNGRETEAGRDLEANETRLPIHTYTISYNGEDYEIKARSYEVWAVTSVVRSRNRLRNSWIATHCFSVCLRLCHSCRNFSVIVRQLIKFHYMLLLLVIGFELLYNVIVGVIRPYKGHN